MTKAEKKLITEFKADMLNIAVSQAEKLKKMRIELDAGLKTISDYIKIDTTPNKMVMGTSNSDFVCKIDVEMHRDILLPKEILQVRVGAFQKEITAIMLKYEISKVNASMLKKYVQKTEESPQKTG